MPLISDSIGKVLGNRYRLVAALGSGASAHVYLAEDVTLQRRVAVKVLQPALSHEESFLKRFRAEARSVASLNHPNILRVFDWGEDGVRLEVRGSQLVGTVEFRSAGDPDRRSWKFRLGKLS